MLKICQEGWEVQVFVFVGMVGRVLVEVVVPRRKRAVVGFEVREQRVRSPSRPGWQLIGRVEVMVPVKGILQW
jgi:hypothetical protein